MKALAKRYLALVLSVLMVVSLIGTVSFADPETGTTGQETEQTQEAGGTYSKTMKVGDTMTLAELAAEVGITDTTVSGFTSNLPDASVVTLSPKSLQGTVTAVAEGETAIEWDNAAETQTYRISIKVEKKEEPTYSKTMKVGDTMTLAELADEVGITDTTVSGFTSNLPDASVVTLSPVSLQGTVTAVAEGETAIEWDNAAETQTYRINIKVEKPTTVLEATFLDKDGAQFGDKVQANEQGIVIPPTSTPTPPDNKEFDFWHLEGVETGYDWTQPITQNTTFYPAWKDATTTGWDVTYNEDHSVATLTCVDPASDLNGKSYTVTMTAEDAYYDVVEGKYKGADYKVAAVDGGDVPAEVKALIGKKPGLTGKRYSVNSTQLKAGGVGNLNLTANPSENYWASVFLPEDKDTPGKAEYVYTKFHLYYVSVEMNEPTGGFVEDDKEPLVEKAVVKPANDAAAFVYSVDSETGPFSDEAKNIGYKAANNPHSLYYKVIPTDSNADALFGPAKAGDFEVAEAHEHDWDFSRSKQDENGVRHIYCKNEGCDYYENPACVSLTAEKDVIYSGEDAKVTDKVEGDREKLFTVTNIKYYIGSEEKTDLTQPGEYTVIADFNISGEKQGTVWKKITVVKATVEPNGSGEANNEFDYGDTANLVKDPAWEPAQNGYTIKYKLDDAAEYADAIPTAEGLDAGNHTVTWQVFDSEGTAVETAAATGTIPIIIRQKEIVVTPPTTQNKVYNTQLQTIATPAETPLDPAVEGLTLKYAVSEKGKSGSLVEWDTTIPQKKDAATYEIALKVFAGDNPVTGNNYKFVVAKGGDEYDFDTPLEATIAKADPMDPDNGAVEPEGVNIPYNGEGQKLVEKDTGKTVDYEDAPPILYSLSKDDGYGETIPTGTDVNNYIVYWKVVGNDNYEDASGQFTSKIYQEEYLTPPVAAKDLVYDGNDKQLLSKAAVLGEEAPEGAQIVYAVTDSDTPPAADKYSSPYDSEALPAETVGKEAGEYYIWYKVVKDGEDLTQADYVVAEIDKAEAEFTEEPTAKSSEYAGKNRWLTTKGSTEDGKIYFSFDGEEYSTNRPGAIDADEYTIWYYIKGDKNHYDSEPATLNAEITPRVVILNWLGENEDPDDFDYIYDGTEKQPTATVKNLVTREDTGEEDVVTVTVGGGQTNVGEYTDENGAEAIALGGADADNYQLPEDAYHDFKISPQVVTIKWYGENDSETDFAYTYNGEEQGPTAKAFVGDEEVADLYVSVDGWETNASDSPYTATATDLSDDNYALPEEGDPSLKQEFTIAKKPVTIDNINAKDKVYDGKKAAQMDGTPNINGKVGNDNVYVKSATMAFENKNAGSNKTVNISTVELGGEAAGNYDVSDFQKKTTASITPLKANLKWFGENGSAEDFDYIYNGKKQCPTAEVTNLQKDDEDATDVVAVTVTGAQKNAGEHNATAAALTGKDKDNYELKNDAHEFTISPKEVRVIWVPDTTEFVYDGKDHEPDAYVNPDDVVEGDDPYDLDVYQRGSSRWMIDVGDYTVTATEVDDYYGNYVLKKDDPSLTFTFTITQRTAELSWDPDPAEYTYDGKPHVPTATVANLVQYRSDTGKPDTCTVTVDGAQKDAGTYTATASGLSNNNYKLPDNKTFGFKINPREVEIEWSNTEFTYDGKPHLPTATVKNPVEGEVLAATVETPQTEAGTHDATVTGLTPTETAKNYKLPDPLPSTKFTINKAELTVTASDQSIYYGEDFDKTKVTYSGWAEGDDESKLETPATVTSNYFKNAKPGTYKLTPSGAAAKNYTFKYVDGKLTVKNKVTWLVAKAASQGSKRGRLSWNKVTGAKTYEVWFARCNSKTKKYRMKKVATVKGNSYTKGGLKKGVCYKYYVIAKDAKGKRIAKSLDAHFAVGNNNRAGTNCKTLTVNKTSVSLAAGKTFTIKAKQMGYVAKKRLLDGTHTKLFRYTSTNKAVATVNAKGKITAVGKGYCQVYVQACNGLWKAINVTVK